MVEACALDGSTLQIVLRWTPPGNKKIWENKTWPGENCDSQASQDELNLEGEAPHVATNKEGGRNLRGGRGLKSK